MTTGWVVWEHLSEAEQRALASAFDLRPVRRLDWEGFDEVDRLMRQRPGGELGKLLAGKEIDRGV